MADRNEYLNRAFRPSWAPADNPEIASLSAMNPMGDTRFDPFMGTPWGRFFDSLNGAKMQAPGLAPSETLDESSVDTHLSPYAVQAHGRLQSAVKGIR